MGNYNFMVRTKRWAKFFINTARGKLHGLDFSMVYVGELQKNTREFHGYSMTDGEEMKRMLRSLPVDASQLAFLDVGCGKGMCLKCAKELGYRKVAGLDLDKHLLEIAKRNMQKLKLEVDCLYGNAVDFEHYADYDVFYFYNPFGKSVFEQVIGKIKLSQRTRPRNIWVVYYHPVVGELFESAGFTYVNEVYSKSRDTTANIYCYSKLQEGDAK